MTYICANKSKIGKRGRTNENELSTSHLVLRTRAIVDEQNIYEEVKSDAHQENHKILSSTCDATSLQAGLIKNPEYIKETEARDEDIEGNDAAESV